ncbi:MAG TPA: tRNA (adenosine(37)-N6)-threonylcarbamoyltransferase complex ATPase subunit type 1 TsaE [Bacteriovoracaceae bacterium]|nr:tRNA (adenosine(37)-N6)-threonylcarbamoyltransferase complex ATPase subunit type 1 TsaE [Bacteriovoracaceae bacterium]
MNKKILREWKKVYRSDLPYIVYELKDLARVPAMLVLEGELGAGKTTFTQSFVGDKEVLSPTYSILSENKSFLHADFYRVEKNEDILQLELPIYLENKQYFFVEWGMKFCRRLLRELPENFTPYLMEISINPGASDHLEGPSRNFVLYSLHED